MRSRTLLTIIISLLLLAAISAKAQVDPNLPDTVYVDSVFTNTSGGVVPVFFANDQPLAGVEVTIRHNNDPGFIVLDSISFIGSRVEYLTNRFLTNHPLDSAYTISAFPLSESLIPAGSGLLCYMHFSFSGALDSTVIILDSTTVSNLDREWSVKFSDSVANWFYPQFERGYLYINSSICCIGNRGNVNNDPQDAVNILDLTYLVNRIFRSGPAPVCTEEANLNSDPSETVNILDLTFIVNLIFRNGPQPGPCP